AVKIQQTARQSALPHHDAGSPHDEGAQLFALPRLLPRARPTRLLFVLRDQLPPAVDSNARPSLLLANGLRQSAILQAHPMQLQRTSQGLQLDALRAETPEFGDSHGQLIQER